MSHKPPMPENGQSPFPLRQKDVGARADGRHELAEQAASNMKAGTEAPPRWPRYAAGAAIGSAAIVAGLLYYNRSKTA